MMVGKRTDEIGRTERSKKQNEDGLKSMKVEDGIHNVGRGHGIFMTGSRNVEANRESLRSLDVVGGTSAEQVGKPRDVECGRRQRRGRREARRQFNASNFDRPTERRYSSYGEN
jgi:hypothetical protein